MRKLYPILVAVLLLPAVVNAASPGTPREAPGVITLQQAIDHALASTRSDLAAGKLNAWGGGQGGGIRPASLAGAGALFNPTGGKAVYVIGVTAPNARGHVRVIVDARSGAVLDTKVSSFQWGVTAPDWWVKGQNSPPSAKR